MHMQSPMRPDVRVKCKDSVYKSPICRASCVTQHSLIFDRHEYNQFMDGEGSGLSVDTHTCSLLSSYRVSCIVQRKNEEVVQQELHVSGG